MEIPHEVFVECEVSEGVFSDEAVVRVADRSYVVPKGEVRAGTGSTKGRVRAKLVRSGGDEWVVLPTDYSESVYKSRVTIVD